MMALSAEAIEQIEDLRQWLLHEHSDHTTRFCFEFTEEQVLDLASGYVPNSLKAACRAALDWAEEDQRRADRPVKGTRRKAAQA